MQFHQTPPDAKKPTSARFKLHPVTAAIIIVTAAISTAVQAVAQRAGVSDIIAHWGVLALTLLFFIGLGWIAYRVAGCSSLVGNVIVALLALLFYGMAPFGALIHQTFNSTRAAQIKNQAVFNELQAELRKEIRAMHKRIAAGEAINPEAAIFDLRVGMLKKCPQRMTGPGSVCASIVAAEFEGARDTIASYTKNWTELGARGSIASWAHSPDDLEDVIADVRRLRETNKEIQDRFVHLEQTVEKRMLDEGVDEKSVRAVVGQFGREYDVRTIMRVRRLDDIAAEGYIDMAQILLDEWGAWEWNPEQEMTLFQSDEAIERFNAAAQKIQDAAAEQEKL